MKSNFPTISVALATFNGERYLEEQLESLAQQTFLPAELVVGDDASTDSTLQILECFAARAPFPVSISRNPQSLGYRKNFLQTAARCSGDWIAFCDQDDIWLPGKLEQCARAIAENDRLNVVMQNAALCDAQLNITRERFPDKLKPGVYGSNQQYGFSVWPGFLMSVRGTLLRDFTGHQPPPSFIERHPVQSHDQWSCMVSNALGGVCVLPDSVVLYRRHESAVSGRYARETLRHRLRQARATGSAHYGHLSWVAAESAAALRRLAGSALAAESSRRFLAGARAFDRLSRIQAARSNLYSGGGLAERLRSYLLSWRAGGYLGPRFVAMGFRSAVKDGFVALLGRRTLSDLRSSPLQRQI